MHDMNINRIFLIALAVLGLSACHKNNPDSARKDNAINVTADVLDQATRSGYDEQSLPAKFYLTLIQDENDLESGYNYLNEEMIKGENNDYATATGAALVWMDKGHSYVKANAYTTADDVFSVLEDQTSEVNLKKSDLLGAAGQDMTIEADNLNVNFRHMLCKLDVTFIWDEAITAEHKQVTSVVYSGFGVDVSLDRDEAVVDEGKETGDIHAFLNHNNENNTYLAEAVFAPQTADMAILIKARIGNSDKEYKLDLLPPAEGFEVGNSYTINVKISKEVVYFGATPTLKDWEVENQLDFTKKKTVVFSASTDNSATEVK